MESNWSIQERIKNEEELRDIRADDADDERDQKKVHPLVMQKLVQPRCKSSVWVYFQRLDTSVARCRVCLGNYKFGSSISNLRHHIQVKHPAVLKDGPLKFIEQLKSPREHIDTALPEPGRYRVEKPIIKSKKKRRMEYTEVKIEPAQVSQVKKSILDEEDLQRTLDAIYEDGDETINDYIQFPSSADSEFVHNESHAHLDSSNMATSLRDEEPEIDVIQSREFENSNQVTYSSGDAKIQTLREDLIRAETNYFNKKALYMERNAEYVEVQKRHLMLQTQKLRMEIMTMKNGYHNT